MSRIQDIQIWAQIKTEYEMASNEKGEEKSIRQIGKEFGVSESTIRERIKKEGWTRTPRAQIIDIQRNLEKIAHAAHPAQIPYIEEKLEEILQLRKEIKSFIIDAVKVNRMNMKAALSEPDDITRMSMVAKMRANMVDLPIITGIIPDVKNIEIEDEGKDNEIRFILE